ncbi:MAG: alcohol dehydrogenase catalytic domain-containing protein [Myxacorys californica WJT36-NPBG1]|nr:alcohol dehydrogenase catalytic domain-containing protein [Myxacorys californica WJT36-NPBG1]
MDVQGLIVTAPRRVSKQRLSVPEPVATDLVVRVEFCGLCTPEQRVYRGTRATYPYWGGHELAGVVEAAPYSPADFKVGDRVAVLLMQRCGVCHACRKGFDNHCAYLHTGSRPGLPIGPGGLVDRIIVPSYKAFRVPQLLSAEKAALIEPVACVLRSIERARPRAGEQAAVIGGGTMGLLHTALLTRKGCRVFLFDDDEATYSQGIAAGAVSCEALSAVEDTQKQNAWTDGWGFDLVACTRFGARAVTLALSALARGGRIVLYQSITDNDDVRIGANLVHYREIEIIGTVAQSAANVSAAVALMAHDHFFLDILRTEIIPASRAEDAFEAALSPQVNRVLIDLRSTFV